MLFRSSSSAGKGPVSPSTGRPERPSIAGGGKKTVFDPITKTNVPRKPIKQQAGGTVTRRGVPETPEQSVASQQHHEENRAKHEAVGAERSQKEQHKQNEVGKDAQQGMVTQPNSGGPAWKGKNLDDNPVGDSYGSGDCAASPDAAAWPGRVL